MTDELRTTLHHIADSTPPLPVGDDLWQRGRAARRRGRAFAVAAVLALVVSLGGVATLMSTTDREARTASSVEVEGGAIPSVIDTTNVPFETELPTGRVSVAFYFNGGMTLIGAEDGSYHQFAPDDQALVPALNPVLALAPDGERLAWATPERIAIADLESGEILTFAHNAGRGAEVGAMSWQPDSTVLLWNGREDGESVGGLIDVTGPSELSTTVGRYGTRGLRSPSIEVVALPSRGEVTAAPFLTLPARGETAGEPLDRPLPADLYPAGALIRPLGWAEDSLVVALVDPPQSDVVERPRLAIFTSPDRPESEWTYREFLFRLPPVESLSLAVDLIPDLDGTSSQQLTHDFASTSDERDISWIIGLGVAAAIVVLMGLGWLWRRFAR